MKTLQLVLVAVTIAVAAAEGWGDSYGEAESRMSCRRTETDPSLDGGAGTQLLNNLKTMSLALLEGTNTDASHHCVKLTLKVTDGAYDYTYKDSAGTQKRITGFMKFQKAMSKTRPMFILTGLPPYALGSNAAGRAELYPKLVTPTEVLLQSCRGWLFKNRRSYLFTTNDLKTIDVNCATRKLKEVYGIKAALAPMKCGSRMGQFQEEDEEEDQLSQDREEQY